MTDLGRLVHAKFVQGSVFVPAMAACEVRWTFQAEAAIAHLLTADMACGLQLGLRLSQCLHCRERYS